MSAKQSPRWRAADRTDPNWEIKLRLYLFTNVTEDECWEWTGTRDKNGYGVLSWRTGGSTSAYRTVWEELCGPIPKGLELDHLCRNRACVNPDHLEVVTKSENSLRMWAYRRGDGR